MSEDRDPLRPAVLGADGRRVDRDAPEPVRRRRAWDVALSILLLAITGLAGFLGAVLSFFTLAFLDCQVAECDANVGVTTQFVAGMLVLVVIAAGVIGTVWALVRRRRGWWIALLAFSLVVAIWAVGLVSFGAAYRVG